MLREWSCRHAGVAQAKEAGRNEGHGQVRLNGEWGIGCTATCSASIDAVKGGRCELDYSRHLDYSRCRLWTAGWSLPASMARHAVGKQVAPVAPGRSPGLHCHDHMHVYCVPPTEQHFLEAPGMQSHPGR